MDLRQTPQYAAYMKQTGWVVETLGDSTQPIFVYFRRLPLLPLTVCKLQRFSKLPDFQALDQLRHKHHALYTVLEPDYNCPHWETVYKHGFQLSRSPFLPTATIRIDLTDSPQKLWSDLSTNAQRILNKPTNITIQNTSIKDFYRAWKTSAKLWPLPLKSLTVMSKTFGDKAELLTSQLNDQILSGMLLLKTDDGAFYYQTWTSPQGRQLNAHFYLVWNTILRLKKEGVKYFDFDGIYDNRFPLPNWKGFSEFKYKFSHQTLLYPGCFSRLL